MGLSVSFGLSGWEGWWTRIWFGGSIGCGNWRATQETKAALSPSTTPAIKDVLLDLFYSPVWSCLGMFGYPSQRNQRQLSSTPWPRFERSLCHKRCRSKAGRGGGLNGSALVIVTEVLPWQNCFWNQAPKNKKKKKEAKTISLTEPFEDFVELSGARYQFRIAKIQQQALNNASGHLPHPLKQLELVTQKKSKSKRSHHAGCSSKLFPLHVFSPLQATTGMLLHVQWFSVWFWEKVAEAACPWRKAHHAGLDCGIQKASERTTWGWHLLRLRW